MNMDLSVIIIVGVIIFLGGIVQSVCGFAYAIFATPLLVWLGISLPDSITLVSTCSMFQAIIGVRTLQGEVPWRLSITASVIRLVSLVIGLLLLKKLVSMHISYIRMVIGSILTLITIIQLVWKLEPVRTLHWGWDVIAFTASGLIGGICGMGGPPLVLWAVSHDWSTEKTRAFLFSVFVISTPIQILLMTFTFGITILWNVGLAIIFLPLIYLGASFGVPFGNRIGMEKLRRVVYVILLLIGLGSIAGGALGG